MKKKILYGIITIISMLFILILCQNKVEAATVLNDKIAYSVEWRDNKEYISIQAVGKYITSINAGDIPTTIDGKPVTKIAYGGFKDCKYLEKVVLPSSITEIDTYAFANCSSLTSINIPDGVKTIGYFAFSGCSSLKSITLKNVTKIESEAFYGCSNLSYVSLPNTLKEIEDAAFSGCSSLKSINLPNSLTDLGDTVFFESGLTSITVPSSVTYMESNYGIFENCKSLKTVNFNAKVKRLPSNFCKGCTALTTVNFSSSSPITEFESSAFEGCNALASITLPLKLTNISRDCFYGCTSLTNITIPDTVTSVGMRAFANCSKLQNIKFSSSVRTIDSYTFEGCTALRNIYFTKSIQNIDEDAFYNLNTSLITIYGYEGTAAKPYAQEHNMKFIQCTPVSSIKISGNSKVVKGKTITLRATVSPSNAYNDSVKWTSSDESIAKVDQSGVVRGINGGRVTIAATSRDGTFVKARYTVTVSLTELPFKDVNMNNWFYNSVKFVSNKKYITGTTSTTFKPNDRLTRGQLASILCRMAGNPKATGGKNFPDVKSSDYYYNAVKWASANKIVNGYSNGKFGPNDYVTREQLAVMLQNYAKYKKKNITKTTNISKFKDSSGVAPYARSAVKWAVANKIISGKENGTKIVPRGNATRAEAAAMIEAYCSYVK